MGAARDLIASSIRTGLDLLTETWQYRKRTSTGAAAPAYDAWVDIEVHATQRTESREYDDERDTVMRRERVRVRVKDTAADLVLGDQVKDPDGDIWGMDGAISSGPGTRSYEFVRDHAVLTQGNRGGTL